MKISFTLLTLKKVSRSIKNIIDDYLRNVSRISSIIFSVAVYFISSEDRYVNKVKLLLTIILIFLVI